MSSYFPIPNNFLICKKENVYVECSIRLFNYPNNASLKALINSDKKKDIFFTLYQLNKFKWIKIEDKKCEYGESCEYKRGNLNLDPKSTTIILPSKNKNNPNETTFLPKPYSLRIDKSPINERASYNFKLKNVSTSYQGEFPFDLSKSGKTFFASDILRSDFEKDTKTYFILMNLNRSSKIKKEHEVNIYSSKTGKVIKQYFVTNNSFNAYLLPKNYSKDIRDSLFLSCKTTSFIPIFINIKFCNKTIEISAEHTHPPHELFFGAERFKILSTLRNNWLN